MKRNTNMLSKRLLEIEEELRADLELSEITLHDKSMRCPGIKLKWLKIQFEEQRMLARLEQEKEKIQDQYKASYGDRGEKTYVAASNIAKKLKADENYDKIEQAIELQKEVLRFLDGALKLMREFSYDISNSIKIVQLEN
ncbi:MAG TPA: recombination mediator protein UvsY [Saccharofermentans sp.]|nr:recombination mediator protein UvsY [Saccharofermentans sp.]